MKLAARLFDRLKAHLRADWRARWLLANALGWCGGLFGAVLLLRLLPGWFSLVLSVPLLGVILGLAQGQALREQAGFPVRAWLGWTVLGIGLAAPFAAVILLPIGAVALSLRALLPGLIAGLLAGGLVGGLLGWMQANALRGQVAAGRWLLVCGGGGALCGLLTLLPVIPGLPVGLVAGALVYGWLTARVFSAPSTSQGRT